jgi:hypothetical protein
MKRSLVVVILFFIIAQISEGQLWRQKRYEAIVGLGSSHFFGDVGGYTKTKNILGLKDITFKQTRFDFNMGLRYRILDDLSARLSLTYGILNATDERGSNPDRGMEAKTSIFEPALIGEYCFIKSKMENSFLFSRGRKTPFKSVISSIDIYAFTGIGGLSYNVKGNDKLVARGLKNSGFAAVIPAGIGLNMLIRPEYNFGIEIGGRYAFSDYLDGYTSQFSSSNDVYYFFNFTFTYKILTGSNGLPAFLSKNRF